MVAEITSIAAGRGVCSEEREASDSKRSLREINVTTKSTKDTKGNQIEKSFVIFVCFVVDKHYPNLEEKTGPLAKDAKEKDQESFLCDLGGLGEKIFVEFVLLNILSVRICHMSQELTV